jgi:hypothetical protein
MIATNAIPVVAQVSKHARTVIDGLFYDIFDPSRNGKPCVYGY